MLVIKSFSAITVISGIIVDMSEFPTSKHLFSWTSLAPQNNESAEKKKTTRISHAGAYIKSLLVQCTLNAIRKKRKPEIRNRYFSVKKRRGHKKAIITIARMLLTAIYNVLKENKSYNAKIYCQTDKPPVQRTVTVDEVVYILLRQEYIVIPSPVWPLCKSFLTI